eukprot:TRINITY_DN6268_c0_g1_i2.p1 TRINITY_DN6268_c0_g1~~TRINITY_DN6268_c0_g1_i2.p1  ORF type:complete len:294 (+),score=60.28 TRINITY_DN6268_c0_g1_i2:254-1135(+)
MPTAMTSVPDEIAESQEQQQTKNSIVQSSSEEKQRQMRARSRARTEQDLTPQSNKTSASAEEIDRPSSERGIGAKQVRSRTPRNDLSLSAKNRKTKEDLDNGEGTSRSEKVQVRPRSQSRTPNEREAQSGPSVQPDQRSSAAGSEGTSRSEKVQLRPRSQSRTPNESEAQSGPSVQPDQRSSAAGSLNFDEDLGGTFGSQEDFASFQVQYDSVPAAVKGQSDLESSWNIYRELVKYFQNQPDASPLKKPTLGRVLGLKIAGKKASDSLDSITFLGLIKNTRVGVFIPLEKLPL